MTFICSTNITMPLSLILMQSTGNSEKSRTLFLIVIYQYTLRAIVMNFIPIKVSSERVRRRKGSLTKKRLSSKTVASLSTSEPDLVLLSNAFRISRITNVEGNGS